MNRRLAPLLGVLLLGCAVDLDGSRAALEAQGFDSIDRLEPVYVFTGCSKDDNSAVQFRARNSKGRTVTGVVCCGGLFSFKSCTVRF